MSNTNYSPNQENSDADSSMSSLWTLNKKDYEDRIAFLQEQNIKLQHQNIQLKLSEQQQKSLYQIQLEQNNFKQKKIHYFENKVDRLINQICQLKSKLNLLSTEYDTLIASSQSLTDDQKRKGSSEYITKEILCQRDESSIFGDIMDESRMMRQNNNLLVQNRRSQRVININNDNKEFKLNRQVRSEQQQNPRHKNVNNILTNQFLASIGEVKEVNSNLNDDKQQKQKQLVKKQVKEQQIYIFSSKDTINRQEKIQQANKQPLQIFVKFEQKLVINDDHNPVLNTIQQDNVDEPVLLQSNRNQQIQQPKINNQKQQTIPQINNQPTATIQAAIQLTKNQVNQQRQQKIQECQLSECCDTTIQQIHQHLSQQVEQIPVPGYDVFVEGLQLQQQPQQPQQEIRQEQINHKDLAKALLSEVEKIGKNIVRNDVPKILGLFRKKR